MDVEDISMKDYWAAHKAMMSNAIATNSEIHSVTMIAEEGVWGAFIRKSRDILTGIPQRRSSVRCDWIPSPRGRDFVHYLGRNTKDPEKYSDIFEQVP